MLVWIDVARDLLRWNNPSDDRVEKVADFLCDLSVVNPDSFLKLDDLVMDQALSFEEACEMLGLSSPI